VNSRECENCSRRGGEIPLVVAVVGLVLAQTQNNALTQQVNDQQARIAQLQNHQAANQASAVAALNAQIRPHGRELTSANRRISSLNARIANFVACIPRLQQQINGMNISANTTDGFLTSVSPNDPTIISTDCNSMLNG
jgi:septal ring factor EnvC (AmiA/AmiB activator)